MKRNEDWSGCDTAYESLAKAYEQRDVHAKKDSRSIGEAGAALGRELAKVRECFSADREFGKVRAEHFPKLENKEVSYWMKWAKVPKEERMQIYENGAAMTADGLYRAHRKLVSDSPKPPPVDAKPTPRPTWVDWAYEEGMIPSLKWGASTRKFIAKLESEHPHIDVKNPAHEERFREACAKMRARDAVAAKRYRPTLNRIAEEADAATEALAPSAQERLESALRKRNKVLEKEYARRYWNDVNAQVKKLVDEAMKKEWERVQSYAQGVKEDIVEAQNLKHMAEAALNKDPSKVVILMDKKDFQKLAGLIHPDRFPVDLRARMDEVMSLLNSARVRG